MGLTASPTNQCRVQHETWRGAGSRTPVGPGETQQIALHLMVLRPLGIAGSVHTATDNGRDKLAHFMALSHFSHFALEEDLRFASQMRNASANRRFFA